MIPIQRQGNSEEGCSQGEGSIKVDVCQASPGIGGEAKGGLHAVSARRVNVQAAVQRLHHKHVLPQLHTIIRNFRFSRS